MVARRGKLTWTAPKEQGRVLLPQPHRREVKLEGPEVEKYMVSLLPGTLWTTAVSLRVEADTYCANPARYHQHPHRYLVLDDYYAGTSYNFKPGTLAVYAGQVRVSEAGPDNVVMRPTRHTFIVGGVQYMTLNLLEYTPVT
jgi:hypothetical protein